MPEKRTRTKGGKEVRHVVRVTVQEELILQAKADELGVTVARLLADTTLNTVHVVRPRVAITELFAIRAQLLKVHSEADLQQTLQAIDNWISSN